MVDSKYKYIYGEGEGERERDRGETYSQQMLLKVLNALCLPQDNRNLSKIHTKVAAK